MFEVYDSLGKELQEEEFDLVSVTVIYRSLIGPCKILLVNTVSLEIFLVTDKSFSFRLSHS